MTRPSGIAVRMMMPHAEMPPHGAFFLPSKCPVLPGKQGCSLPHSEPGNPGLSYRTCSTIRPVRPVGRIRPIGPISPVPLFFAPFRGGSAADVCSLSDILGCLPPHFEVGSQHGSGLREREQRCAISHSGRGSQPNANIGARLTTVYHLISRGNHSVFCVTI